nr:hypothetical protein [Mycoplasmopsis bovis]
MALKQTLALKAEGSDESIADLISSYSAKCGEKIELRRFVLIDAGTSQSVSTFVHINGKIGAILLTNGVNAEVCKKRSNALKRNESWVYICWRYSIICVREICFWI